ncbi:MAG: RtcB family protein [Saprospiraceae bacterium]|nr:RtcB family protein [Saprospiraceae bacterium]
MQVVFKNGFKVPVKMWNDTVPMETGVFEQTGNLARLPFIFKHVAVMPDAHVGKGFTVGSVIPTNKALIPAAVICAARMRALLTNRQLPTKTSIM